MTGPGMGAKIGNPSEPVRQHVEIKKAVFNVPKFLEKLKSTAENFDGGKLTKEIIDSFCSDVVFILECSPEVFDPKQKDGGIDWNSRGFFPQVFREASTEEISEIRSNLFESLLKAKNEGRLIWEDTEIKRIPTWGEVKTLLGCLGVNITKLSDFPDEGRFSSSSLRPYGKEPLLEIEMI